MTAHERPSHLPWCCTLVIRASRVLTLGEKCIWEDFRAFDRGDPDACYIGAQSLSERWGNDFTVATIEAFRARLGRLGLLTRIRRPEGGFGFIALLPAHCIPNEVIIGKMRPACRAPEAKQLASFLDDHIREREAEKRRKAEVEPPFKTERGGNRTPIQESDANELNADSTAADSRQLNGDSRHLGKGGRGVPLSSAVPSVQSTLSPRLSSSQEERVIPTESKEEREKGLEEIRVTTQRAWDEIRRRREQRRQA